ncbi:MAG: succinate dehydrogenase, cytochrome b556 subunit [Coxiella sp. RIFCSPHIGHO2_12_FULL_42_15]|nr:MAG: succinate dehydrogenase, cytochrome b556 subunit [Coxiella sp. RIFCSPHIGHO2_12_FULL_42_15]
MNKTRPVNLDLTQFRFPPMAIVSICHRISGVLLFLFIPILIYFLHQTLLSPEHFATALNTLQKGGMRFLFWVMMCVTLFHLVAGVRHLIMDMGFGESVTAGRNSAIAVFIIAIILFILVGVWLW